MKFGCVCVVGIFIYVHTDTDTSTGLEARPREKSSQWKFMQCADNSTNTKKNQNNPVKTGKIKKKKKFKEQIAKRKKKGN